MTFLLSFIASFGLFYFPNESRNQHTIPLSISVVVYCVSIMHDLMSFPYCPHFHDHLLWNIFNNIRFRSFVSRISRTGFDPLSPWRLPHTGPRMRIAGLRGGRYFTFFEVVGVMTLAARMLERTHVGAKKHYLCQWPKLYFLIFR